jgi:dTDP-4-dehydrorhamnose reductase
MSTIVIGGTGILGRELKRVDPSLICLDSKYDVFTFDKLKHELKTRPTKVIIHCAAIKSEKVDLDPVHSMNVNIVGTCNLTRYCIENGVRLVYISTDYVYPGVNGDYKEIDPVLPANKYASTKLAGESAASLVNDHLIIRTSFGESKFPYPKAYDNLFVSKDYVDIIAPMILSLSLSAEKGIINVGTERKSLFEYASKRNVVERSSLPQAKDFSLNVDKFNEWKSK